MNSKPAAIVIRDIDRLSEMREVEDLQKEIWGVEDREVFPALAMIPLHEVGAILIGAFDQNQPAENFDRLGGAALTFGAE